MNPSDPLQPPAWYAEHYPVSLSTLYSACQDGLLAHYRIPAKKGKRGKYLIKLSDFITWLESYRHEAGESVPQAPKVKPQAFDHLKL
ncbi:helix-turn-helix domain-containing protein [Gemmata sp.]|uniref:helix-turn-helix domain-containing protein n=1 Tax=Gemmata sp. TaxID=1914242 RepID=UPI003F70848D